LSVRDTVKFSEPVLPRIAGQPSDWDILNGLMRGILKNRGGLGRLGAPMVSLSGALSPRRIISLLMRIGPQPQTLKQVIAAPHGIDLGPLTPDRLRKRPLHLAQPFFTDDLVRLAQRLDQPVPALQLIGRRSLRSMNSWMHNVPKLVAGRDRCTLRIHPEDAARHGVAQADKALLSGPAGTFEVPLELSDEMMPGVVSLPHGWGHPEDSGQRTAAGRGVNINALLDPARVDALSGTSVLSGIEVTVGPAP
jgi:hypothetical protein